MAKTLSVRVETTSKLVVPLPHSAWLKLVLNPPPLFFVGVKLRLPSPPPVL